MHFYRPQTKVVLLDLSVSHSVHGGESLPQCMMGYTHTHNRPREADHPPPPCSACWEIRATSGRYASYWNAYLCIKISLSWGKSRSRECKTNSDGSEVRRFTSKTKGYFTWQSRTLEHNRINFLVLVWHQLSFIMMSHVLSRLFLRC